MPEPGEHIGGFRIEREARTLASLNHPNIAAIHGVEDDGSRRFLILEYVDGETLDARLARGRVPMDEALAIARGIASALEAAHERGIVHRDLKPGNVIVTPDGGVKVLDFGLARTGDDSAAEAGSDSPTFTAARPSPTIPGVIMGTAGYMSPEQARGKPVDRRSDIFSFGCVLYELLTGHRPFQGETVSDAIGAVLHTDPPLERLPPETPPRVRDVLRRCMQKDKRARYRDIGDVLLDLEPQAAGEPAVEASVLAAAHRRARWLAAAAFVAGAALLGAVQWLRPGPTVEPAAPRRFSIGGFSLLVDQFLSIAISPSRRPSPSTALQSVTVYPETSNRHVA